MERRLSVILAADVVGYSKMTGKDKQGTLSALSHPIEELIDLSLQNAMDASLS